HRPDRVHPGRFDRAGGVTAATSRPARRPCANHLMTRVRALGAFLYEFVIGDDPLIAAVVVVALGLTAALAGAGIAAWWVLPVAAVVVLGVSVYRGARS